jgi:hypothetical protein
MLGTIISKKDETTLNAEAKERKELVENRDFKALGDLLQTAHDLGPHGVDVLDQDLINKLAGKKIHTISVNSPAVKAKLIYGRISVQKYSFDDLVMACKKTRNPRKWYQDLLEQTALFNAISKDAEKATRVVLSKAVDSKSFCIKRS